jgi:hypothetical protein
VDLAEEILRKALPSASMFLRALINEGGRATADRLREVTTGHELRAMTLSLNHAARRLAREQLASRRFLALPGRNPDDPRNPAVYDYQLPDGLVPIFDEALRRLDR